ncbi:MAG: FHA domain-containing protein [Lachnospiraceae bacterium]|nr:FHA domain-containing protein [Lachnospiraceae bacterium]
MDIRFKNDANHNYMIIKKEKGPVNANNEKMVIRNSIDGLLRMNLHFLDDEVFYYYDIRSRQSLGRLYEGRYMSGEELTNFFRGMVRVFNELEQYLLPAEGIILDPEYIFVDIDSVSPEFVFYPTGKAGGKQEEALSLAEFLIDHADRNDPLAGRLAYDYYESVTDGVISPAPLLAGIAEKKNDDITSRKKTEMPDIEKESDPDYWETEEDMSELDYFLKKDPAEENDKGLLKIAGICLGLIVVAAVFYLILVLNPSLLPFIRMNDGEYMAAGCVIALLFGIAVTSVIFIYNRRLTEEKEDEKKYKQEKIEKNAKNPDVQKERMEYEDHMEETEDEEKTTLLSPLAGSVTVPYLSGNEMGRSVCISIDTSPFIVGKKGDRVNGELKNSSVSRIHASIREANGRFFLSDMNSTNGTFINGRRLEPNETVALEDGDSVGFAGTVLIFRNQSSCQAC